jgi:rare lipoprotein A (peptidoglycan hydrolase)
MGTKIRIILGIITTYAIVAFIPSTVYSSSNSNDQVTVSYYGGGGPNECGKNRPCHGSRTACGQKFNMYGVSVANETLPCGTKVEFCHEEKCLVAEVTDRGPHVSGRKFDLSWKAAKLLGISGVAFVEARILGI